MRRTRRWLAGLLCAALLAGVLPTTAWASGNGEGTTGPATEAGEGGESIPDSTLLTRAVLAEKIYEKFGDALPSGGTAPNFDDIEVSESGVTQEQYNAIIALAQAGVLNGTSPTEFTPDGTVTRAELAVVLWRATGCKSHPTEVASPYSDVTGAEPYGPAVLALTAMGIIQGTTEGEFEAEEPASVGMVDALFERYDSNSETVQAASSWETGVTRLDMLMEVYAQYKDDPVLKAKAENGTEIEFSDIGACSDEQQEAIEFFTKAGIISGLNTTPPMFQPDGAASNFQIALLLQMCAEATMPETAATQRIALLSDFMSLMNVGSSGTTPDSQPPDLETMISEAFDFLERQGVNVDAAEENPHAPGVLNNLTAWTASVAPEPPTIDISADGIVTITPAAGDEDAAIYYTTDGSDPSSAESQHRQIYSTPFTPTANAAVQAVAVKNNLTSTVATETYTAPVFTLTASPASLTGGGTVTLTASNLPVGAAGVVDSVTCSDASITITPVQGADGSLSWTAILPNATATYTFTATAGGETTTCTVSVTRYTPSSGGSSSGGSSSRPSTTTETVENEDGSTTTTVTNNRTDTVTETTEYPDGTTTTVVTDGETGAVTETTQYPDGSSRVVETGADGTVTAAETDADGNTTQVSEGTDGAVTTTVARADGGSSVTTADPAGRVTAEVTLPAAVVEGAGGQAVALPMPAVRASADRADAPIVTVELPREAAVRVEIPVEDVTPGTVAVLVEADGTETVIKTSLTTENGVAVTLSDGDTVKIVDNSKTFTDVPDSHWAAEAVDFAASRELFNGTGADTFGPELPLNRAMLVTVFYRLEDTPAVGGGSTFLDVPAGMYYTDAVAWADGSGIVTGDGSGGFVPNRDITREELAVILHRYAQHKGYGTAEQADLSAYADAGSISPYAVQAMAWANAAGLITGDGSGALNPGGSANRSEVAAILQRFMEGFAD